MRALARTSLQSRAWHRRSISAIDRMNRSPSTCRPNAALKSKAPLPKRLRRCRPHGVHTFDSPANDRAARCASISPVARFAASRCERRAQARSRRFARSATKRIADGGATGVPASDRWSPTAPSFACAFKARASRAQSEQARRRAERATASRARGHRRERRARAPFSDAEPTTSRRSRALFPSPAARYAAREAASPDSRPSAARRARPCALARPIAARPHDEGLRNDRSARRPPPDIRRADNPLRSHHAIRVANTPPRASLTTRRT
ncbi:hypothetical protein BG19_5699 [Burkholderia pseudomallei MSHR840]|nr:hypothetical protein BG19_5699 [Burkholderia pseudomallei MSHR840]